MNYIQKFDCNPDFGELANVAVALNQYEEAFQMYDKAQYYERALDVLAMHIKNGERIRNYAKRYNLGPLTPAQEERIYADD